MDRGAWQATVHRVVESQLMSLQSHTRTRTFLHGFLVELPGVVLVDVQFAQSCPTLCDPMAQHQASLSFTISQSLFKLMSIKSVMPSNHLILCCPLLLLPLIFPSIRIFSNKLALPIRWPKYWSFSFSISPSSEYSGLISSRVDWLDLLSVQGTLKSLLQHHSSKALILHCSGSFIAQLSHPYMTIEKNSALTIWIFVRSAFYKMYKLSSFTAKEQVSLNVMAAVTICSDFGAQENKVCHCFHCFPIYLPRSDRTGCDESESESRSIISDLWTRGLHSSWSSPGQNSRVCGFSLLQRIFPTQGLNWGLPYCRQILYQLSHQNAMILGFLLSFKSAFSLSSFTFIRGSLVLLHFLP